MEGLAAFCARKIILHLQKLLLAGCDDIRRDKKERSKPTDIRDKCLRLAIEIDEQSWPRFLSQRTPSPFPASSSPMTRR
jgi:hypothetical protein